MHLIALLDYGASSTSPLFCTFEHRPKTSNTKTNRPTPNPHHHHHKTVIVNTHGALRSPLPSRTIINGVRIFMRAVRCRWRKSMIINKTESGPGCTSSSGGYVVWSVRTCSWPMRSVVVKLFMGLEVSV